MMKNRLAKLLIEKSLQEGTSWYYIKDAFEGLGIELDINGLDAPKNIIGGSVKIPSMGTFDIVGASEKFWIAIDTDDLGIHDQLLRLTMTDYPKDGRIFFRLDGLSDRTEVMLTDGKKFTVGWINKMMRIR